MIIYHQKLKDFYLLEDVQLLYKTPQSPIYHAEGDVGTHTEMVCDALLKLPEWDNFSYEEKSILYYTALFHDIAKGFTLEFDDHGSPRHPNHSLKGAYWWRHYAWLNNIDIYIREHVATLILLHQKLFHIWAKEDYDRHMFKYASMVPLKLLITFAKADILGRIAPDIQSHLDSLSLLTEYAQENHCWDKQPTLAPIERIEWLRHGRGDGYTKLYNGLGSRVHIMIGLPASGKDFFVQKQFAHLPIVSFDNERLILGLKYGENEGKVKQVVLQKAKKLLAERKEFVWNTTNTSLNTFEKTLELLYAYDAYTTAYVLNTEYRLQIQRNQIRGTTVKDSLIHDMAKKWNIPSLNDVHELYYYHNGLLDPRFYSGLECNVKLDM